MEESFIGNLNQSDSLKSVNSENDLEIKKKLLSWSLNPTSFDFIIEDKITECVIENIKI